MTYPLPDQEFRSFLEDGRFMIQRGASSGRYIFYPRVAEPGSGAQDLEWVQASGGGEIYAVTVVHPKPPAKPYNVVLVTLDEGPRMMSRVDADLASVKIGCRVRARIAEIDGSPNVVFDLE